MDILLAVLLALYIGITFWIYTRCVKDTVLYWNSVHSKKGMVKELFILTIGLFIVLFSLVFTIWGSNLLKLL